MPAAKRAQKLQTKKSASLPGDKCPGSARKRGLAPHAGFAPARARHVGARVDGPDLAALSHRRRRGCYLSARVDAGGSLLQFQSSEQGPRRFLLGGCVVFASCWIGVGRSRGRVVRARRGERITATRRRRGLWRRAISGCRVGRREGVVLIALLAFAGPRFRLRAGFPLGRSKRAPNFA
ncbi:hypothetical protein BS78_02G169200 [Paspalum vaginatum]|nr:hypothetical protein BS78_02G169200 [Paspalum vaginatum]